MKTNNFFGRFFALTLITLVHFMQNTQAMNEDKMEGLRNTAICKTPAHNFNGTHYEMARTMGKFILENPNSIEKISDGFIRVRHPLGDQTLLSEKFVEEMICERADDSERMNLERLIETVPEVYDTINNGTIGCIMVTKEEWIDHDAAKMRIIQQLQTVLEERIYMIRKYRIMATASTFIAAFSPLVDNVPLYGKILWFAALGGLVLWYDFL